MPNTDSISIRCSVKKLSVLIDVLNAIERAKHEDLVTSVDVTDDVVTIVGQSLDRLSFYLATVGFHYTVGPNKTHLFIDLGDK